MTVTPDKSLTPLDFSTPEQSSTAVEISAAKCDPRDAFAPEQIRSALPISIPDRIRILAAQGLKPRDISSMLHIHPLMVLRALEHGVTQ